MIDFYTENQRAWDQLARRRIRWSTPVSDEVVADARAGRWHVILTQTRPVPRRWFGDLNGASVLCLASGGGQQAPILAAAGAVVTSYDASTEQLALDQQVAERNALTIMPKQGNMANLQGLDDASFDLVFHPVSNSFVPEVEPVWREAFRVTKPGGRLLAGFQNPDVYLFDYEKLKTTSVYEVAYSLPYADHVDLPEDEFQQFRDAGEPIEFSHTMAAQIGGQLAAGWRIEDFYEERGGGDTDPRACFMPLAFATLATKPR